MFKDRRGLLLIALVGALVLGSTGCGYLKNVRDDVLDVGTLAVGVVPPVVPGGEEGNFGVGFLPPALGIYAQATDLFHLGAIYKATGDLEWDRRGLGAMVDRRWKVGLGPLHSVFIEQEPYYANAYKIPGSKMDGWRAHMEDLADPLFDAPAKVLIYEPEVIDLWAYDEYEGWASLPWLSHGWQSWEFISLEVAIPEPFLLHSGFYFRAGVDPSEFFDLFMSVLTIDIYDDAAYTFSGELKYP